MICSLLVRFRSFELEALLYIRSEMGHPVYDVAEILNTTSQVTEMLKKETTTTNTHIYALFAYE